MWIRYWLLFKCKRKHHITPILASLHLFQTQKFCCLSSLLCMVCENQKPKKKLQPPPRSTAGPLRSSHHGLLAIRSQLKKSADTAPTTAALRMKHSPRIHKVGSLVYLNNHIYTFRLPCSLYCLTWLFQLSRSFLNREGTDVSQHKIATVHILFKNKQQF